MKKALAIIASLLMLSPLSVAAEDVIRRESKPKRIETFADLIQHVQKIDLENTEALVLEDAKGNRYRFVKKETKPRQKRQQLHQMTIIEIIGGNNG